MQLTLFEPAKRRIIKTYHDEKGRFCTKDEAIKKHMRYLEREAEKWRRAYLVVVKQLNKEKRDGWKTEQFSRSIRKESASRKTYADRESNY